MALVLPATTAARTSAANRTRLSSNVEVRALEALAPGLHRQAPAGEFVHFFSYVAAQFLRKSGRCVFKARKHFLRRRRAVLEKTAFLVPHQGALCCILAIAELDQRQLGVGLPHEQIEIIVVKPAPPGRRVVGHSENFFQHRGVNSLTMAPLDRSSGMNYDGSRAPNHDLTRQREYDVLGKGRP